MESIWSKENSMGKYPPLKHGISTDTVIIGGGLAGILIGRRLKEKGIETVVIDADTIGSGQTKNTTAKITSQHGLIYHKLTEYYGAEKARQYAQANEKAIADFEELIIKRSIPCHFEKKALISILCMRKPFYARKRRPRQRPG